MLGDDKCPNCGQLFTCLDPSFHKLPIKQPFALEATPSGDASDKCPLCGKSELCTDQYHARKLEKFRQEESDNWVLENVAPLERPSVEPVIGRGMFADATFDPTRASKQKQVWKSAKAAAKRKP